MRAAAILGFDPVPGDPARLVVLSDVLRRAMRGLVEAHDEADVEAVGLDHAAGREIELTLELRPLAVFIPPPTTGGDAGQSRGTRATSDLHWVSAIPMPLRRGWASARYWRRCTKASSSTPRSKPPASPCAANW